MSTYPGGDSVDRLLFGDPVTSNKTFFHVWVTLGWYQALAARGFPSHEHDRDESHLGRVGSPTR